jgi:hypothetical protein
VWRSVSSVTSSKIIWPVLFYIDKVNFIQIRLETETYHTKNPSVYPPSISGQGGVESPSMVPHHIEYRHRREEYGLDSRDVVGIGLQGDGGVRRISQVLGLCQDVSMEGRFWLSVLLAQHTPENTIPPTILRSPASAAQTK